MAVLCERASQDPVTVTVATAAGVQVTPVPRAAWLSWTAEERWQLLADYARAAAAAAGSPARVLAEWRTEVAIGTNHGRARHTLSVEAGAA